MTTEQYIDIFQIKEGTKSATAVSMKYNEFLKPFISRFGRYQGVDIFILLYIVALFPLILCCGDKAQNHDEEPRPGGYRNDCLASWSETHDVIAYFHGQGRPEFDDQDSSGIYLVKPNGTENRIFYRNDFIVGLAWSNRGDKIAFSTNWGLYTITYPDGIIDTLKEPGQFYDPSWALDDSRIVSAVHASDSNGIYIINSDGTDHHLILPFSMDPSWVYEDSIIYNNLDDLFPYGSICISDSDGSGNRMIYDLEDPFVWSEVYPKLHYPTNRIIFQGNIPGEASRIMRLAPDSSEAELLHATAVYPIFSPDGNRIVFTYTPYGYGNLWIINWNGTDLFQLTEPLLGGNR